jgi:hypothetical protein
MNTEGGRIDTLEAERIRQRRHFEAERIDRSQRRQEAERIRMPESIGQRSYGRGAERIHRPQLGFAQGSRPDCTHGNRRKVKYLLRCWGILVRFWLYCCVRETMRICVSDYCFLRDHLTKAAGGT